MTESAVETHLTASRARDVPVLAVRVPDEAAATLGVSADFFKEHVLPEIRVVRRGRLKFVAVVELERWLERNAALTLEGRL